MEAIVLVGGLGTRLRGVVDDRPKPMAAVRGRPFLAFVLDRMVESGFTRAVLAAGYRHEALRAHFGDDYRGLELVYSIEDAPLGTGGAIRLACERVTARDVFVVNGDTYLEVDYRAMLRAHVGAGASLTIAVCRVADASRYGALEMAGDRVTGFEEKSRSGPGWINGGTYVLARPVLGRLPGDGAFSFEAFLDREVADLRPRGFPCSGAFIDIGTPDDYARAEALLPAYPLPRSAPCS